MNPENIRESKKENEMREIKAIIQPFMLQDVLHALAAMDDLPGVTISEVTGWGKSRAAGAKETTRRGGHAVAKKAKLEIVVSAKLAPRVVATIAEAARTGNPGDGKIFEFDVSNAVKVRTGESGEEAL